MGHFVIKFHQECQELETVWTTLGPIRGIFLIRIYRRLFKTKPIGHRVQLLLNIYTILTYEIAGNIFLW